MFFFIPNSNFNFKFYSLDTVLLVLFLEDFSPAHSYESTMWYALKGSPNLQVSGENTLPEGYQRCWHLMG